MAGGPPKVGEYECSENVIPRPVGALSPQGDGFFGHADLGGNAFEFVYDWFSETPAFPCGRDACVRVSAEKPLRVLHGGSWRYPAYHMLNRTRESSPPQVREDSVGFRCARESER
ncbi:MAG TPA: SUMF1/EgtB/PvdO family nonheme iron enzyme [Labilithrix sp.]|nr:SUMF1/EgtB/PvdO family nonheme iron enzyme [Labilithrix sp.]